MPTTTFSAHKDSYTKKADPDANFGTETKVWVQRGSLVGDNPRYGFAAVDYDLSAQAGFARIVEAVLELGNASTSSGFPLETYTLDGAWTETGITWNNQPTLDTLLDDAVSDATASETRFEVTGAVADLLAAAGRVEVGLRHAEEPQGTGVENVAWWGREGNTAPRLVVIWEAQAEHELACSLTVRRSATGELSSAVEPRFHESLPSYLDVVYPARLLTTVTPGLHPLETRARIQGIVTRLLVDPFDDFRRITHEAGSKVTRAQDGATSEVRRIVQVVAAGTPAFSLSETPTFPGADTGSPDTMRRGDAILFAVGDEPWEPRARVTWRGRGFEVAGVLGVERVGDEVLYQEVGLRRLSVTVRGRLQGTVVVA